MRFEDFRRIFPLRSERLMWFLGAGASASGGISTAWELIEDFKLDLYCAANDLNGGELASISPVSLREMVNQDLSARGITPSAGEDEYSYYFSMDFPSAADRRRRIQEWLVNSHTSIGHRILAKLLVERQVRICWTTNFDQLVESGVAELTRRSDSLNVVSLSNANEAPRYLANEQWPLLIKLHGDFQSEKLKNTSDELQAQDQNLRQTLVRASLSYGLCVSGYSGRDSSVMDALNECIDQREAFPHGLFWFVRSMKQLAPPVSKLIKRARELGVEAEIIEVPSFDEMFRSIYKMIGQDDDFKDMRQSANALVAYQRTQSQGESPVIRLNSFRIEPTAIECRRVTCHSNSISYSEIEEIRSGRVVAVKTGSGVLAFGSRDVVSRAFQPYGLERIELLTFQWHHISQDSSAHGLLTQAVAKSLSRGRPLRIHSRGNRKDSRSVDPLTE